MKPVWTDQKKILVPRKTQRMFLYPEKDISNKKQRKKQKYR